MAAYCSTGRQSVQNMLCTYVPPKHTEEVVNVLDSVYDTVQTPVQLDLCPYTHSNSSPVCVCVCVLI